MSTRLTTMCTLATALSLACRQAPQTGQVQGDVYLVMRSGDVKRAAGNEVRLLRDTDTLRNAMAQVCTTYEDTLRAALRWGPVISALDWTTTFGRRARAQVEEILVKGVLDRAPTGVNAHYRFPTVQPGKYVLWAETDLGDNHYTWWAPIHVSAGDSLTQDLDTGAEAEARLSCDDALTAVVQAAQAQESAERAARQQEVAMRRQNWMRCFEKAADAGGVYACNARWLRTSADSQWADSIWLRARQ